MTTAALGAREEAPLIFTEPPRAARTRARRALLAELALLLLSLVLLTPTVLAAAGHPQPWLALATRSHLARELTGFAGLFVVALQVSLAAGKRLRRLGERGRRRWLALHKVTGPLLLLVVAVHTGGTSGSNANALLWASLCAMLALAQGGHVFKAWVHLRASAANAAAGALELDQAANGESGWVHLAGYHTHVVLAVVVTLLVAVHVACVYYY
jgi:hypothetical protein